MLKLKFQIPVCAFPSKKEIIHNTSLVDLRDLRFVYDSIKNSSFVNKHSQAQVKTYMCPEHRYKKGKFSL